MSKKHKAHDEEHIDETWLIPYADLLTLLLALFIVLFASSSVDAHKFDELSAALKSALSGGASFFEKSPSISASDQQDLKSKKKTDSRDQVEKNKDKNKEQSQQTKDIQALIQKETQDLEKLKKQIDNYIQQNGLTTQLKTVLDNQQLIIKISDNALFPSGSATLKPEAQALAVAISNLLMQYPQYEIVVAGHTDNNPINTVEFDSNWDLSTKRAVNFMKILLLNPKIQPKEYSAVGYGEYRPVESNDTEAGRSANRRVEVSIIRNIKDITADSNTIVSSPLPVK